MAPSFVEVTALVMPHSPPIGSLDVVLRDALSVPVKPNFDDGVAASGLSREGDALMLPTRTRG